MEIRLRLLCIRLLSLVALALRAAFLMTYVRPKAVMCPFDLDCSKILFSPYGEYVCSLSMRPQLNLRAAPLALLYLNRLEANKE